MKISHIFAATGLMVAAMTASTSADAQRYHGDRGWHHGERGWHGRGYYYGPRWRPAHYYGWRYQRCWTEWRWHHRVRVCR